jgi:hypothetical protein
MSDAPITLVRIIFQDLFNPLKMRFSPVVGAGGMTRWL